MIAWLVIVAFLLGAGSTMAWSLRGVRRLNQDWRVSQGWIDRAERDKRDGRTR